MRPPHFDVHQSGTVNNIVKGHNPYDYFGIFDVVRFDTVWLDKA
jgi:hypothetical protein